MTEHYDGIKNFEYDYFSEGYESKSSTTAFLNKPNVCALTYLPELGNSKAMYSVYQQLVNELAACKDLGNKEEPTQTAGKMATFKSGKKTFITLTASEYTMEIQLRISRKAETEK